MKQRAQIRIETDQSWTKGVEKWKYTLDLVDLTLPFYVLFFNILKGSVRLFVNSIVHNVIQDDVNN